MLHNMSKKDSGRAVERWWNKGVERRARPEHMEVLAGLDDMDALAGLDDMKVLAGIDDMEALAGLEGQW